MATVLTPSAPRPTTDLVGDVERFIQDLVADLEPDPVHPGPDRPRIVVVLDNASVHRAAAVRWARSR